MATTNTLKPVISMDMIAEHGLSADFYESLGAVLLEAGVSFRIRMSPTAAKHLAGELLAAAAKAGKAPGSVG